MSTLVCTWRGDRHFQERTETQKGEVLPKTSNPVSAKLGFEPSYAWIQIQAQSSTVATPSTG